MNDALEDARKLAHGTYDDVIVVEHRKHTDGISTVLEMPEGSRVVDTAQQYDIDGVIGTAAPTVGASYRVSVGPSSTPTQSGAGTASASVRYQTRGR